jgi:hypothetical protein
MKQEAVYSVKLNGSSYIVRVIDENELTPAQRSIIAQQSRTSSLTRRPAPWVTAKRIAHLPMR